MNLFPHPRADEAETVATWEPELRFRFYAAVCEKRGVRAAWDLMDEVSAIQTEGEA